MKKQPTPQSWHLPLVNNKKTFTAKHPCSIIKVGGEKYGEKNIE